MAFCSSCGTETKTGKFCHNCGKQLVDMSSHSTNEAPVPIAHHNNNNLAMWAHLAPLIAAFTLFWLVFPIFLLWLPPLIMRNSAKTEFERRHITESLNFQLMQLVLLVPAIVLIIVTFGIGYLAVIAFSIVSLVFMIMATVAASGGREYRYPISIRFVK
jgi:uncharacterized Tic20 family protein